MLHFGVKPPFSVEKFLTICPDFVPEKDIALLQRVSVAKTYSGDMPVPPIVAQWIAFDTALGNALVKVRAVRKHAEAAAYVRPDKYVGAPLEQIALTAQRNPSPLEAEQFLDQERWKALDELAVGHYFDIEALVVYACKLSILERWENIRTVPKEALLEQALTAAV